MFWTDATQASERLHNSIVNYDGKPTLIDHVFPVGADVVCDAVILGATKRENFSLSDVKWNNFRDLPRLGWFNYVSEGRGKITPVFTERRAVNSRVHGLSSNNTASFHLTPEGVVKNCSPCLSEYLKNPGYQETMDSEEAFPKLSSILMALDEEPGGVAFSYKFCVVVTEEGIKWLFRKNRRIGFFTGADSLNLFPKNGYFKEELQACPSFDITNVREF